jgi:hypothetical protein
MITTVDKLYEQNYIEQQLFQLAPLPITEENFPYGFDIQIQTLGRKTNFLRINAAQLKRIEEVLRSDE